MIDKFYGVSIGIDCIIIEFNPHCAVVISRPHVSMSIEKGILVKLTIDGVMSEGVSVPGLALNKPTGATANQCEGVIFIIKLVCRTKGERIVVPGICLSPVESQETQFYVVIIHNSAYFATIYVFNSCPG